MSFIPDTGHYVTERTARVIAAALKENNKIPTSFFGVSFLVIYHMVLTGRNDGATIMVEQFISSLNFILEWLEYHCDDVHCGEGIQRK